MSEEEKKIKIEKLKFLEGIFRTLVFTLLTLGAGEGTVLYRMVVDSGFRLYLDIAYSIILLIVITIVSFSIFKVWKKIRDEFKEL